MWPPVRASSLLGEWLLLVLVWAPEPERDLRAGCLEQPWCRIGLSKQCPAI